MKSARLTATAVAATLTALAVASPATAGHNDGKLSRLEAVSGAAAKFRRLNTDKDWTLEPDETHGVLTRRGFALADTSKDGKLSLFEYLRYTRLVFRHANPDKDWTIEGGEFHTPMGRLLLRLVK